jgi:hypothetical protein
VEHRRDEHRVALQRRPALQDDPLEPAAVALQPRDGLATDRDAVAGQQLREVTVQRLAVAAEHQVIGEAGQVQREPHALRRRAEHRQAPAGYLEAVQ